VLSGTFFSFRGFPFYYGVQTDGEIIALFTSQLAQMEQRLMNAIRKSQKPDTQCPFLRRKEAIQRVLGR
jgi:hypothetical protein